MYGSYAIKIFNFETTGLFGADGRGGVCVNRMPSSILHACGLYVYTQVDWGSIIQIGYRYVEVVRSGVRVCVGGGVL